MYHLTLTKDQAAALSAACELYSRIAMGQIEEIVPIVPNRSAVGQLRQSLDEIRHLATGLDSGYRSIAATGPRARAAFDLHQVIRHRLAWDETPTGGLLVQFDQPWRLGDESLPTIARDAKESTK